MAAIQLNFSLRTSANCKTVHLLGSWDNYNGQLPLSKDASKAGAWKGTFRFQGATLKQGQRYWYYYIIDGHHASHDPAREFVREPTTGRNLNTLDIPAAAAPAAKRQSRRISQDIPKGRALSPSKIVSPKPVKPNQTRHLTAADMSSHPTVEELTSRFTAAAIDSDSEDDESDDDSDADSDVPSLSSSRSSSSRASSVSSTGSCCTCNRYGITRSGDRVMLDCGGSRCGSDVDSCSSDSESEMEAIRSTRRHGIIVRS